MGLNKDHTNMFMTKLKGSSFWNRYFIWMDQVEAIDNIWKLQMSLFKLRVSQTKKNVMW